MIEKKVECRKAPDGRYYLDMTIEDIGIYFDSFREGRYYWTLYRGGYEVAMIPLAAANIRKMVDC